jgi:glycosyltransferase involved in cell wall biosynthesis
MSDHPLRVSVVIPALNEETTLAAVVNAVIESLADRELEVVIVDDGSSDATPAVIERLVSANPRVRHTRHGQPRGKGSALRTGFALAGGDVLVIQDADLEYAPADLPTLLRPLDDGQADAVYGSRFAGAGPPQSGFWSALANRLITGTANLAYRSAFSDVYTGAKALRAELVRSLHLTSRSFTIEAELTAKLWRSGARFREVPIRYRPRGVEEGKKIRARDTLRALGAVLVHRFTRLRREA